jgi:hypothetical protein
MAFNGKCLAAVQKAGYDGALGRVRHPWSTSCDTSPSMGFCKMMLVRELCTDPDLIVAERNLRKATTIWFRHCTFFVGELSILWHRHAERVRKP